MIGVKSILAGRFADVTQPYLAALRIFGQFHRTLNWLSRKRTGSTTGRPGCVRQRGDLCQYVGSGRFELFDRGGHRSDDFLFENFTFFDRFGIVNRRNVWSKP